MVAIPFPTETSPGRYPAESGGRLINAMAEELGDGALSKAVLTRAPGLRSFVDTGRNGFRGAAYIAPYVYAAYENFAVAYTSSGVLSVISALSGSRPVDFARNNKVPLPDVVVVTEDGAFVLTGTTFTEYPEPELPPPVSVCSIDGYFIFATRDGGLYNSALNSTAMTTLDNARAEANPDGLLRVIGFQSQLYAMGTASIEIWSNTGNPVGFPFSRAAVIPRGIIGSRAVTGHEDGFSKQVMLVGDDCQVYALNGYQLSRISTPDLDRLIASDPAKQDIECWSYTIDGHSCLVVTGSTWTWVYDLQTRKWHERRSHLSDRWRATGSVFAFGKWLVGDRASTKLQELSSAALREDDAPLEFIVQSGQGSAFPNRLRVNRVDLNMVVGVGSATGDDPIETDPQLKLEWSDDGGVFFSTPLMIPLGAQGETLTRVTRTRCGLTGPMGRVWRVSVSDPVPVGLMSGDMTVEQRTP